jgi:cystathionine beta-lyase
MYNFDELIPRKGTDSVKYDLRREVFGDDGVIPMWVADMDFRTPDFIVDAVKRRAAHEIYGYSIRGNEWYQALIRWLNRRHGWKTEKDWIVFSPGIVPAINMAVLSYTQPGDSIIVQPPVYTPFLEAVKNHGRTLVYNPLKAENGRLNMDMDDLERKAAMGAKMLILSSPHNPGGSVWTRDELTAMMQICLRYDMIVFSDEIHSDLVYFENKHTVLATLSPEVARRVVTAVAPSKTFNIAGMATSALIISDDGLRQRFSKTIENLHVGLGNLFGNIAAQAAYTYGDKWLDELLNYLSANLDLAEAFFKTQMPQIKMFRPQGTYLVWLDCRGLNMNDNELRDFMIHKAGLGLNEGCSFGPGGEGFMRMNVACPQATLREALEKLKKAVK